MNYPKDELFEQLAAIEHERWADWQKYMHSLCDAGVDGSLCITPINVKHWTRQIETKYSELSEKEKDSDREQVMRYWNLITKRKNTPKDDKSIKFWDRRNFSTTLHRP